MVCESYRILILSNFNALRLRTFSHKISTCFKTHQRPVGTMLVNRLLLLQKVPCHFRPQCFQLITQTCVSCTQRSVQLIYSVLAGPPVIRLSIECGDIFLTVFLKPILITSIKLSLTPTTKVAEKAKMYRYIGKPIQISVLFSLFDQSSLAAFTNFLNLVVL